MVEKLSYRMLLLGGAPAGLLGLNELLETLFERGICPDDLELPQLLLDGIRQHNFVPKPAVSTYQEGLVREYDRYYADRQGNHSFIRPSYGTWRGYPREQISWFPTIAVELCTGCGHCLEFCSYGIFEKLADGKVIVIEPFLCRVGCSSCMSVCEPKAILFPPRQMLEDYRPRG